MNKNAKIYIAGHRGLVGSAILNNLTSKGYTNFITKTHKELNLANQQEVAQFFEVTEGAISKAKKELNIDVVKNVGLETAHQVIGKSCTTYQGEWP